jgi:tetratricopeptide (TPR) repeat protein
MAFRESGLNLIFIGMAVVLAVIAIAGIFISSRQPEIMPAGITAPPDALPDVLPDPVRQSVDRAAMMAQLEQMIAVHPDNAEYHARIADLHFELGHYDNAIIHYRQSLALNPGNPNVETDLATCYHYIGMDDEALEILEKVTREHPDFSQAKFNKGVVLIYGKNDLERGLSIWEDLLRSDPDFQHREELQQRIQQVKRALGSATVEKSP